jgi:hypothetical protein
MIRSKEELVAAGIHGPLMENVPRPSIPSERSAVLIGSGGFGVELAGCME